MQYLNNIEMARIMAIVVTYNPDMTLLIDNLKLIENQVEKIIIVNNSSYELALGYSDKVSIINNNENLGIAKALNIGLQYAIANNYDYALMLDQDSTPDTDMVKYEIDKFTCDNVAMVVPRIVYLNIDNDENNIIEKEYVKFAITSGSIIRLNYVDSIGYFDEGFFIDSVDFDYCFKIRLKNYKIIRANEAKLYQRLGELRMYKFLFFRFYPTNHNYIRRYYITRNRLYIWMRYWKYDKKFVVKNFLRNLYEMLLILLFEDDKVRKFKHVFKGILDFHKGKVGKME
jgi:rhamnosyltransferase